MKKPLKWLLCAKWKLDVEEFVALVSIKFEGEFKKIGQKDVVRICCNFVVLDKELNDFRFAYFLVKEFLETRSEYASAAAHALTAEAPFSGQTAGLGWYECEYDGNLRSMALAILLSDGRRWQI